MAPAPTVSRIFATQYSREATRLERLHAHHLHHGAKTWGEALDGIEHLMPYLDGPIRRAAVVRDAAAYLKKTQPGSMHFVLGTYNSNKRSSVLSFATINFDHHPLLGVDEDGVGIMQHTITCRRNGNGSAVANESLGYVSRHAVQRMHERAHNKLTINDATQIFTCVGMLGHMMGASEKHVDAAMYLRIGDMLAVGTVRHAIGLPERVSKQTVCTFFEVRTFLDAHNIGDTKAAMNQQGRIAMDVLHEWVNTGREDDTTQKLVDQIPYISHNVANDFVLQKAIKTTDGVV